MSDEEAESDDDVGIAIDEADRFTHEDEPPVDGEALELDEAEMEFVTEGEPEPLADEPPEFLSMSEMRDEEPLAEELFGAGISKELVDDLTALVDTMDSTTVPPPAEDLFGESPVDVDVIEEIEVDPDTAERLLKVVYKKLNQYQVEHGQLPEQLVLGVPQFKAIEAYTWKREEQSAEERLPVDEVLVVPGPQIHCVQDPYVLVEESLQEETDDAG